MPRQETCSAQERFHTPCEGPDSWHHNNLLINNNPIDNSAVLAPSRGKTSATPSLPFESLQRYLLHQRARHVKRDLEEAGKGRTDPLPGDSNLRAALPAATATSAVTSETYADADEPSWSRAQRLSPTGNQQDGCSLSDPLHEDPCAVQTAQPGVDQAGRSAGPGSPPPGGICCSPLRKPRSISQPRSVRDLVPRVDSSREFPCSISPNPRPDAEQVKPDA